MKTIRQISGYWEPNQIRILHDFGIDVNEGIQSFIIEENEVYHQLEPLLAEWNILNTRSFIFSDQEIKTASYCVLKGWHEVGYPMPDGNNGYIHLTYDDCKLCHHCFCGLVQKSSFRIKIIPKWNIWGLNWIYDELFTRREIYDDFFSLYGIGYKDVRDYKTDNIINGVVQLLIPVADESLDLSKYDKTICSVCGMTKYGAKDNGFFPVYKNQTFHIFKTKEFFGYDGNCFRKIIVSSDMREALVERKLFKLHDFIPCK